MIAWSPMSDVPHRHLLRPAADCDSHRCDERVGRLLDCVDRIYRSAEQPGHLHEALARLAELVGAGSALVFAVDGTERRLIAAAHAPSEASSGRARLPVTSLGLRTVPLAGGFELVLERSHLPESELAVLVQLAPHLARAIRLAERIGGRSSTAHDHGAELDRVPLGVVLLSASREVVALNRAARGVLANCSSIGLVEQRLVATRPAARAMLESLIERVTAQPVADRRFVGGHLELEDDCWKRLDVLVLRAASEPLAPGTVGAVLLSAPGAAISAEQRFRDLFALDPLEAQVAVDLLVGKPPAGLPPDRDPTAVVQSIYRKVGTTRQSDLLHYVLRPPGVVFEQAARRRLS